MKPAPRIAALALLLAVPALPAPVWAATPSCTVLAVAPDYPTSRVAACHQMRYIGGGQREIRVFVSRDGMRSWTKATSIGFTATPNTTADMMFFVGSTLFLQTTDQGLLFSDDLGENFHVADPLGGSPNGRDNLTPAPWGAPAALPGFPAVEIAYGDIAPNGASMIRPPVHQRVVGSTDTDVKFVPYVAAGGEHRWLSLAYRIPSPAAPQPAATLWGCDAALTCSEPLHEFAGSEPYGVVLAPDFGRSGVALVKTEDTGTRLQRLWRTADGGRSFTEAGPVAALRREILGRRLGSDIVTHVTFTGGRGVVLSLEWLDLVQPMPNVPRRQVLASADLGATWRPVSRTGPGGTLPGLTVGPIQHVAGRLFTVMWSEDFEGLRPYCSRDGGRTWRTYCD